MTLALTVLLIGKGAREHALAWKLARSPLLSKLFVWPGHAAMAAHAERLDLPADASHAEVVAAAKRAGVELIVVGPEGPLEQGFADVAEAAGLPTFGPRREAAKLEASKAFAKDVMARAGIPTAAYAVATGEEQCRELARATLARTGGVVLKASGLAAGKGVFVCTSAGEVDAGLEHLYRTDMKKAAETVVVEELLKGRECSYFSFVGADGATGLGFAVDYKRLEDGDVGPNTGGMGCYAPVPWLPADAEAQVVRRVVEPLLKELERRGIAYRGCLYVGLMWGERGPQVVEFNVRLGDPEAQALAVYDERDWLAQIAAKVGVEVPAAALAAARADLPAGRAAAVGVVMASRGYPFGQGEVAGSELPVAFKTQNGGGDGRGARVFAAAVTGEAEPLTSAPGRVLTVVARGADFAAARASAYAEVERIGKSWTTARWRRDIGLRTGGE